VSLIVDFFTYLLHVYFIFLHYFFTIAAIPNKPFYLSIARLLTRTVSWRTVLLEYVIFPKVV